MDANRACARDVFGDLSPLPDFSEWGRREEEERKRRDEQTCAKLTAGIVKTSMLRRLVARMQRTHERRRASFFVGPPGIGKSTAIRAFRANNPGQVLVISVMKKNTTGTQALQQMVLALRMHQGHDKRYVTNARCQVQQEIDERIAKSCGYLSSDADPSDFPTLTVVFDEAQRLTNDAIDSLRDYNEPHFSCRGAFPLGMIFVGNNELSLQASSDGKSILDQGMADRLLYRDRLSYDDVERDDLAAFILSLGINDKGALDAIVASFTGQFAQQRSFRRIADFIDELRDEALNQPITRATVQAVLGLA